MDWQGLVDSVNEASKHERAKYHVTLGELIKVLSIGDDSADVVFDDGGSPTDPRSYRGYYSDLAFDTTADTRSVAEVIESAESVYGEELTGYKGGKFLMDEDVPLWRASWGDSGDPILDIEHSSEVVLITE